MEPQVTAQAGANIAFIKYWGNKPDGPNLPLNPSISMTLAACVTRTTVALRPSASEDEILLDGRTPDEKIAARVGGFLQSVRDIAGRKERTRVESGNNFPTGCGIASSASGFAALALAASSAYGLGLDRRGLSRLARLGSGSAARSVMGGFVELKPGETHEAAYAAQIAPEDAWPDLRDVVVLVSREQKKVSSAEGHRLAHTSEMYPGRLSAVPERAGRVRKAILDRNLALLGEAAEADALSMHAVMMTSKPPLLYWHPRTIEVIRCVWELRQKGIEAYFTIDAGPNVHILTRERSVPAVDEAIRTRFGCSTITDRPGPGASLVEGADS